MLYETEIQAPGEELVLVRDFAAPLDLMWRVWTEPDLLMQWWGPENFTAPSSSVDLSPGGRWQVTMQGPAGTEFAGEYPIDAKILEADPPGRLLMELDFDADDVPGGTMHIEMDIRLEALGPGVTRQTIRQKFTSAAVRDANLARGAKEGWNGSFAKLDRLLAARDGSAG